MTRQPVLFVSHGAPTLTLEPGPTAGFLRGLGEIVRGESPRAVLCFSAHWESGTPDVGLVELPETIHDFSGFPDVLYDQRHPAPGDPALGQKALTLLRGSGIEAAGDPERGLDHGAWVPMRLMDPEATIPVVQVAIATARGARFMFDVGRALAPLRDEGVLIMGSGGATHNLREFGRHAYDAEPVAWARDFDDWLVRAIEDGRTEDLLAWEERAPDPRRNHPTHEHFLPLIAALGAGVGSGETRGRRLNAAFTYGVLSMAAFSW
ncbi:MAG TPA: class III extradiol ring-cleavage dioxygenase [Candidatus Polarisedimenticolia bacterium]|nr:class III extradiol ring-cleavage dioxygenase [Candidatus Polarisedimenticolia bacterium]